MAFNDDQTTLAAKAEQRMNKTLSTVQTNADEYQDSHPVKVITRRDINIMALRALLLQASFNYERMQAGGWLYALIPGLRKIHKNEEDLKNSMKMHLEFINVHPFDCTFLMGICLAMEQHKENISVIRAVKVALMGPMGGIGDALFWLTLLPICAGIGASLALQGSIFAPFVFLILFNIFHFGLIFGLAHYGFSAGTGALDALKKHTKRISHAASIVGLTVIGALVASYVKFSTPFVIHAGKATIPLQTGVLDKLMPNLLPLGYTLLIFWLMKKNFSPIKLIGLTVLIGVVGKLCGIL